MNCSGRIKCSTIGALKAFSPLHRVNMEVNLQSLFGLLCTAVPINLDTTQHPAPLPPLLGSYTRTLLVSKIDDIYGTARGPKRDVVYLG